MEVDRVVENDFIKIDVVAEKEKDSENEVGNPRLANALVKALRMGKNKNGKTLVLSKAKLYNPKPASKKPHGFEIVPDPNNGEIMEKKEAFNPVIEEKPEKKELKKFKITKQEKFGRGRLKPSPLDKEKEKPLVKIATKGVVQLFNAVSQQQSAIHKEINKPGITEGKKEKILKSINKKAFLDVLMGKKRNEGETEENAEMSNVAEEVKTEPEDEEPSWKVLRDNFMMGAKLKDWDKKEIEAMEEMDNGFVQFIHMPLKDKLSFLIMAQIRGYYENEIGGFKRKRGENQHTDYNLTTKWSKQITKYSCKRNKFSLNTIYVL